MKFTVFAVTMLFALPTFSQSLPVEAGYDDPVFVEWVTGESLQIRLQQISDSRCARGAVCIWEGEVTVLLELETNGMVAREAELTIPARDDREAVAVVDDFVIRLVAVGPYPVLDEEPERSEYRVSLVISSPGHDDRTHLKGKWQLQSLAIEGETLTALPGTELTMAIDMADDGRGFASGSGGCNGFTASVGIGENGSVALADLGFTDMACGTPAGVMDQEERFYAVLPAVESFAVDGQELRLYGLAGTLVFVQSDVATAIDNTTWGRIKGRLRDHQSD